MAVIFSHLVIGSSFPACWRLADVFSVPKGSPSSEVGDYRPILITLSHSKVFEKIMAGKLSNFLESNSLLPPSQCSYCKGLGGCGALLTLSHRLQVALDRSMEERIVQFDFSVAFDRVCHYGLLYKLRYIDVE